MRKTGNFSPHSNQEDLKIQRLGKSLSYSKQEISNVKGGKMDKKVILWIVIALLVIGVIYVSFFKGGSTGSAVNAVQSAGQVASSGMVGGC